MALTGIMLEQSSEPLTWRDITVHTQTPINMVGTSNGSINTDADGQENVAMSATPRAVKHSSATQEMENPVFLSQF